MSSNNYSPLRYPGGKAKVLPFVKALIKANFETNKEVIYIEPYAGGAAVALGLLIDGYVTNIYINDADPAIYCFWDNVLRHSRKFINKIHDTEISISEWERQSKIYRENKHSNARQRFDLGFATFFLNRCNHSGVLKGGIIGGKKQQGKYTINCRFNKEDLIKRIKRIAKLKNNIHLSCEDAHSLLKSNAISELISKASLLYLDPPYYVKGKQLYKNSYTHEDHCKIAELMKSIDGAWIVSYDDVPSIRNLYKWVDRNRVLDINLMYSVAHTSKNGKEVMFISKKLQTIQNKESKF